MFEVPVKWGIDLQSEHERFLCEQYCDNKPLFLTHYPESIKPFYMKQVDGKVVEAMDLLVPRIVCLAAVVFLSIGRNHWRKCERK